MFQSAGNNKQWPKNVPGKPTQLAVIGVDQKNGQLKYETTFTGKFPDLDKAMYWGAKKEIDAIRRGFASACRVIWQHELTPEKAVDEMWQHMEPQFRRAVLAADVGFDPASAMGDGPMKPVDYSKVEGMYVEVDGPEVDPENN